MLTASARPDPNAPFARAEITVRGLAASPSSPAFQLRRSNVDYVEPNLDLGGWTRAEVVLLPLDAWWVEGERSFHLLISGLLCQFIDPGPLKLRLPGPDGGEVDLFWPEDISVYDDGMLAAHARVLTDTVRVVGSAAVVAPPPPFPPPPPSLPPPAETVPVVDPVVAAAPLPSPWTTPPAPPPVVQRKRFSRRWSILFPIAVGAGVIGAVASRREVMVPPGHPSPLSPAPRREGSGGINVQPRAPDETSVTMRAAMDRVMGELTTARRADFDPFLALRSTTEIIGRAATPEALLRYGATKLDQREGAAADRLFEEATRPRFGPGQNRPFAPAFVARGLLYDPSLQHDLALPLPNAGFAQTLYRRAIGSGDADAAAYASRYLQRLLAWEAQHSNR